MPRKLTDVRDSQYLFFSGGGTAYAPADGDALACRAAVEGTEEESAGFGAVDCVEAGPVYVVGGWGEGFVEVPEEGGGVG